jgi:hypothetical protein
MVNNASGIALDIAGGSMITHKEHTHFNVWVWSISFAVMNLTFNLAHFELSWIYRSLAHNVPSILNHQRDE